MLAHFLRLLMRRLLLEDLPRESVDRSAAALLPLILAQPAAFHHIGAPTQYWASKGHGIGSVSNLPKRDHRGRIQLGVILLRSRLENEINPLGP